MLSCFQTTCCEGELTTSDGKIVCGGCTVHAQTCAGGTGIFLRVKKCQIVLLSEAIRGNIQLGCHCCKRNQNHQNFPLSLSGLGTSTDQFQPRLKLVGAGPKPRERQRGIVMIIKTPLCLSLGLGPAPTNSSRGWN